MSLVKKSQTLGVKVKFTHINGNLLFQFTAIKTLPVIHWEPEIAQRAASEGTKGFPAALFHFSSLLCITKPYN